MQIPVNNIIEKIKSETGMSEDEVKSKINSKMEELAGLVSEEGAAHIVANEMNIKLAADIPQEIKLADIKPFMKNLNVIGKVTNIYDLVEYKKEDKSGKVRSCFIGDDTGRIRATFWHDATDGITDVKEGDILKIIAVNSRENNGRAEVHVSAPDQITVNPEGIEIEVTKNTQDPKVKKIVEMGEDKYGSILGTIVQAFKPNFFFNCPECRSKLKQEEEKYICEEHGETEANLGYVMNVFIDDGTDVMRCVFFNEQMDEVLGKSHEFFIENHSNTEVMDTTRAESIGKIVKVVGKIRDNAYFNRKELVANKVVLDVDISKELAEK